MMHRSPRITRFWLRVIALVLVCLAIAGLLLFLTPRAAAAQVPGRAAGDSTPVAQAGARSVVALLLRDTDTLVVERIRRNPRSVTAVIAGPGSPRVSLQYTLGADHLIPITAFSVGAANASADAPPMQSGSLTLTADSAFLTITAGGSTRDIRVATEANALPVVNNDLVVVEQAVRRARAEGVTDLTVPLFALSAAQTVDARLVLVGTDSARFSLMNNITTVAIDSAGNVTGGEVAAQGIRIVVLEGDSAAAAALPAPATAQNGADPAWSRALDSLIAAELARTGTPGVQVAVVANGRLAYTKGYGQADIESGRPVTAQTLFRVGSVTKMVTAATLSQLSAQGLLDLHAPIGRYVTELAGRRVADVTTHQLLTHSAGWIDNATAYGRMGEGALGEVFREVSDTLFFTEPGRVISYSNPGYSMAGYVSERAGKARFGDLADRLVLRKMGMPRATFRPLSALTHDFSQGHVGIPGKEPGIVRPFTENTAQWAAGFLFASAGEMARFTIALMDGGMLEGERMLAPEAVTMMTTGHMAIPGDTTAHYAYGLRVGTTGGERVWAHGGSINGFDAQVTMFPDRKLAVLVFDNRSGSPLRGVVDFVAKAVAGIEPPSGPAEPTPVTLDAAGRALIAGEYAQGGTRTRVEFADVDGKLVLRQGTDSFPATLMSNDEVVVAYPGGSELRVLPVRGARDGRVEYLHRGLRALARQP